MQVVQEVVGSAEIGVVYIEQLPLNEKPLVSLEGQAQEANYEDLLVSLHLRLE